jgi:hypothetical protein
VGGSTPIRSDVIGKGRIQPGWNIESGIARPKNLRYRALSDSSDLIVVARCC